MNILNFFVVVLVSTALVAGIGELCYRACQRRREDKMTCGYYDRHENGEA